MYNLNEITVKYNHPASPPNGISLNKRYKLFTDNGYYIVKDDNGKLELTLDKLKTLFIPINFSWDDLLKENKKRQYKRGRNDSGDAGDVKNSD